MNKARPTMSGSLIKHGAYLKYIKYNTNINNNNNNNNNKIVVVVVVVVVKKKRKQLMRILRWKINVKIKQ
jgi:hypothetical protein